MSNLSTTHRCPLEAFAGPIWRHPLVTTSVSCINASPKIPLEETFVSLKINNERRLSTGARDEVKRIAAVWEAAEILPSFLFCFFSLLFTALPHGGPQTGIR